MLLRKLLKYGAWTLGVVVLLAIATTAIARIIAGRKYNTHWTTHNVSFPIPFPLSAAELETLRGERLAAGAPAVDPLAGVNLQVAALTRAIARGEYLVRTRVACNGCHGVDLGGRVLIDQLLVGYWAPPNLTSGDGSVTRGFTAADWDRAVRQCIRRSGQSSSMPSLEFVNLSDHELSDIVAYVQSRPPVNRVLKAAWIGPLFSFVVAFKPDTLLAFTIDHQKPHPAEPPVEAASVEVGTHIAQAAADVTVSACREERSPVIPRCRSLPTSRRTRQGSRDGRKRISSGRCARANGRTARQSCRRCRGKHTDS
jgi:mono/diheme cytochrome c family protein